MQKQNDIFFSSINSLMQGDFVPLSDAFAPHWVLPGGINEAERFYFDLVRAQDTHTLELADLPKSLLVADGPRPLLAWEEDGICCVRCLNEAEAKALGSHANV